MRVPKSSVDLLAALITMIECKNKVKAAEALGISTSALDKRLRALSERIGVKLLSNNEESWTLSEAGQFFYPEAVKALEHALLAEDKTQAHLLLSANHLLVGHSTYLAPKLLAIIRQLGFDPPSPVHIEHRSGFTTDIVRRVLEGTLHAGFGYFPIQHPDLLVRLLLEEAFVVCLPSDHPLALRVQIRPDDLEQQAFIAVARDTLPALHEEIREHLAGLWHPSSNRSGCVHASRGAGVCRAKGGALSSGRVLRCRPPRHCDSGIVDADPQTPKWIFREGRQPGRPDFGAYSIGSQTGSQIVPHTRLSYPLIY